MPFSARHGCAGVGCRALVPRGQRFCAQHARPRDNDIRNGNSNARGYTSEWRRAAKRYLARNPLCVRHMDIGETVVARHVDHIRPAREHPQLFWDEDNWQALCPPCHGSKTREEMEARR